MHCELEIDVYCHWNDNPPVYRIYVNDELMSERSFGWVSYHFYLTETIYCNLDTGVHSLKLENLDPMSKFELDKFLCNTVPVNKNLLKANNDVIEWKFIVDNQLQTH